MRLPICLAALVLVLAGCSSPPPPAPLPVVDGWQELAAPAAGVRIITFARVGDRLLALGSVPGPDGRAPAAWLTDGHDWRPVPLHPVTGYGEQAEFTRFAVLGDRILVWGMAFGGAHSNPRPTSWAGGADGLTEFEQGVEVFGGPHAVGQYGEAGVGGTGLIVGQWDEEGGGYGASTWTSPDGDTWTRHPIPGAHGVQTSAQGVAAQGNAFLIVGNSSDDGTRATAWTSADGTRYRALPVPDADGAEATTVECTTDAVCAIVGARTAHQRQAVCWPVRGTEIGKPTTGPVGDTLDVQQVAFAGGRTAVVVRLDGQARLFTVSGCQGWQADKLPVTSRDAHLGVLANGKELLATTDEGGSRLWTR